ncbi:MAG: ribonuclease H-like domain-containing protein [Spirochaetales bacterium]|nr:ribonuclease H-like domain-containing protein [Spirochaetales bacterium]
MKPGLSDRLSRLKKAQKEARKEGVKGAVSQAPSPAGAAGKTHPGGGADLQQTPPLKTLKGEWSSPAPDLWVKKRICPSPLADFKSSGLLNSAWPDQKEWLFYDTETTGLSGGAGNIAFLVGIGRPAGDEFHITQFFLKDYPGEAAMLQLLDQEIRRSSLFISYNGKSFDKPLLETRFLMNRFHCRMGDQLDLLYPVRSLFRNRLPDCRLGTVEEQLLAIHREDDIPGAEIPDIWFSFLKEGDHPDLNRVLEHNDMDILSLAVLLKELEAFLINPRQLASRDSCALGRFLLDRHDVRGMEFLKEAVTRSDHKAEVFLSLQLKRTGQWEEAAALWTSILQKRLSPFAAVEMAKYLEHRQKDISGALTLTEKLLRDLPLQDQKLHSALIHRRNRLLQKESRLVEEAGQED